MSNQHGSYHVLADYYDRLMSDVDYEGWADFFLASFTRLGVSPKLILDLGCGTGKLTSALASRGFEMIGVDNSPEMLTYAAALASERGQNILFAEQDMRSFDLYGTVDAVVCSLDCINYLTKKSDVALCFERVYTFLNHGGAFLFDVNTPWKFENLYGNHDYIQEDEGVFLGWENSYTKSTGLCHFTLSFFLEQPNGLYRRVDELQSERCYSDRVLTGLLTDAGFRVADIVSDFAFTKAGKEDERHYFLCVKD